MRKYVLLLLTLMLVACSSEEPIEEPTDASEQIEDNIETIEYYRGKLVEEKQKYDAAGLDAMKETHALIMDDIERKIKSFENENETLEDTLIYNDEFKVVQGTGVYIDKHEGTLTEQTFVSRFNTKMLKELERYKDEISNGAILVAAVPFGDSEEKMPAISVYYSQESLEAIDFDNALENEDRDYLYENADYVKAFDALSDVLGSRGDFDKVNDLFIHYSGMTY